MKNRSRFDDSTHLLVHLFFIVFCLVCIIPFMTVVSASFSNEKDLLLNGFPVWPREWDLTAYKYIMEKPDDILNAYKVTFFITVVGTGAGLICMAMAAYCLARSPYRMKRILTWFIFFPTLFNGGMVATYIIVTQYLNLRDSLLAIILPGMINVFHVFMLRTFFQQLPTSLFEAAKIDGASEYKIFFKIAMPLSKPSLATVGFLNALAKWNEWYNCMLYITSEEKRTLQYLLQTMMKNLEALLNEMQNMPTMANVAALPGENLRMAMLVVAIGPMMLIFPFFQKYFTKGMTVGSVKG